MMCFITSILPSQPRLCVVADPTLSSTAASQQSQHQQQQHRVVPNKWRCEAIQRKRHDRVCNECKNDSRCHAPCRCHRHQRPRPCRPISLLRRTPYWFQGHAHGHDPRGVAPATARTSTAVGPGEEVPASGRFIFDHGELRRNAEPRRVNREGLRFVADDVNMGRALCSAKHNVLRRTERKAGRVQVLGLETTDKRPSVVDAFVHLGLVDKRETP
mmetsp:Transcript_82394/g.229537  ORF Transcript_82394/g.229537 Transcript_82394/m.229537 type:complete len:215 (+) Transcript_82394:109-753(+)